jgi:hypothetical protein
VVLTVKQQLWNPNRNIFAILGFNVCTLIHLFARMHFFGLPQLEWQTTAFWNRTSFEQTCPRNWKIQYKWVKQLS